MCIRDRCVTGLEVVYKQSNGVLVSSGVHLGKDCDRTSKSVFDLDKNEFITEIHVKTGQDSNGIQRIDKIKFFNNKGDRITGGRPGGTYAATIKAAPGSQFSLFNVGISSSLYTFEFQEIPMYQIN
eukprot:TRINITY_DN8228_c0_g1_i2.p1 TRINITY_DN8228_c0_g1~~TRINITY_DN8228_c0_g1_i2.p1  ORF type:complete len:146 (+),score=28.61 TRINITY_DN8228_c0_g1_i2:62-439(+)